MKLQFGSGVEKSRLLFAICRYLIISAITLFSILPIIWMISTSFKPAAEIYATHISWIPHHWIMDNFVKVIREGYIPTAFFNTVIIASGATLLSLLIGIVSGYGFARYHYQGQNLVMSVVMASRILPLSAIAIPLFILLGSLHLTNTYLGLMLGYLTVTVPLTTWMLKGFFEKLPIEIEEAAIIDGCSKLKLLWRVIIPLSTPALFAVGMYSFIASWNEFLLGLVLSADQSTRPVAVALAMYKSEWGIEWGAMMAGCLITSIPPMLLFVVFKKHLITGLVEGSLKG